MFRMNRVARSALVAFSALMLIAGVSFARNIIPDATVSQTTQAGDDDADEGGFEGWQAAAENAPDEEVDVDEWQVDADDAAEADENDQGGNVDDAAEADENDQGGDVDEAEDGDVDDADEADENDDADEADENDDGDSDDGDDDSDDD